MFRPLTMAHWGGAMTATFGGAALYCHTAGHLYGQVGGTLSDIAAKYGTTYQHLAAVDGIANPNKIYVGQVLKIK